MIEGVRLLDLFQTFKINVMTLYEIYQVLPIVFSESTLFAFALYDSMSDEDKEKIAKESPLLTAVPVTELESYLNDLCVDQMIQDALKNVS